MYTPRHMPMHVDEVYLKLRILFIDFVQSGDGAVHVPN